MIPAAAALHPAACTRTDKQNHLMQKWPKGIAFDKGKKKMIEKRSKKRIRRRTRKNTGGEMLEDEKRSLTGGKVIHLKLKPREIITPHVFCCFKFVLFFMN